MGVSSSALVRSTMDPWRKYFWLWVMAGMIFVSVLICLIFILINKCISRADKQRISQRHRGSDFNTKCTKNQEKLDSPPLPPRTQFTGEAKSYENPVDVPDYEESTHDYEQDVPDYEESTHDYEQDVPDYEESTHDYEQDVPDYEESTHDYEQDVPDYEQDVPDYEQDIFDYVKVEEEKIDPPPPPYLDPVSDDTSTQDYDDIGGEEELRGEEDYDDVG